MCILTRYNCKAPLCFCSNKTGFCNCFANWSTFYVARKPVRSLFCKKRCVKFLLYYLFEKHAYKFLVCQNLDLYAYVQYKYVRKTKQSFVLKLLYKKRNLYPYKYKAPNKALLCKTSAKRSFARRFVRKKICTQWFYQQALYL